MRQHALALRELRLVAGQFLTVLCLVSCEGDIPAPPSPPKVEGTLLVTIPDTGTADRASLVRLDATLDSTVARDKRQVVFTTTAGSFAGQTTVTVPADSLGTAHAFLTPPADSTRAFVTATSPTASRTKEITFRRARADAIELVADAFAVDSGLVNSVRLTATLRRIVGLPSPGLTVTFRAERPEGAEIGQLSTRSTVTDAQGNASVRFSIGNLSYHGPVIVVATTDGPDGLPRTARTTITVR